MKKVRKHTFETNSSSTNSLSIDNSNIEIPMKLTIIDNGWGGRDFELRTPDEKFTCLASLCDNTEQLFALCHKMYQFGVEIIKFPSPQEFDLEKNEDYMWIRSGGEIEDPQELKDLLKDDEELKAFIFGKYSSISGRNNEYDD